MDLRVPELVRAMGKRTTDREEAKATLARNVFRAWDTQEQAMRQEEVSKVKRRLILLATMTTIYVVLYGGEALAASGRGATEHLTLPRATLNGS
jgi:hypothetical protein